MNNMPNLLHEAHGFFKHYGEVFDSGDMQAFSTLFVEPFVSVRADGTVVSMPTHSVAESFFTLALRAWQKEGNRYFNAKDHEITPIGSNSLLVTLTWELLDAERKIIREWRQSYNLLKVSSDWKVLASIFHAVG